MDLQAHVDAAAAGGAARFVCKVVGAGPYLNLFVNRALVYYLTVQQVQARAGKFGHGEVHKGKKVIIEHTSSNPNAPLHIGNLRNVMVGAHMAKMMSAVGYDVKQHFYVNDLGAQIGLTALAYSRVYPKLKPSQGVKRDHWIGQMYAVMNTCSELQKVGVDIGRIADAAHESQGAVDEVQEAAVKALEGDEKAQGKVREYVDIFMDLRSRFGELFEVTLDTMRHVPNIQKTSAELNLAYERQEPWAIKIFRKMVTDCLSGVTETLNTYGVRHDSFDFESELGWEGSNDKVLEIIRSSPYYVPETQCNEEGVPQGSYLNMTKFIADQKLPTGKKGYQKEYPNFYVLRPDGSTLYTFRDVVYSFKKASKADMILNVIASEQNLAQEKVALAMYMVGGKQMIGRQTHLTYDIVRLPHGKMSGRRGRYLLADDLYEELKDVIRGVMRAKYDEKGGIDEATFDAVTHEVSSASMKYALLSVGARVQVTFDMKKVTSFEDASAPFILYNSTRVVSLLNKFAERSAAGDARCPPLPPVGECDYSTLDNQAEWELLMDFVLPFYSIIESSACPTFPQLPGLPEFKTHVMCEYLNSFTRRLSSYYRSVRILPGDEPGTGGGDAMHARLQLCKAFKQCIDNGLRLLMIEPLEKM